MKLGCDKCIIFITLSTVILLVQPLSGGAAILFFEDFESSSVFGPQAGYTRDNLSGVGSAPNTSPMLHGNQGGDTEYLYTESSFSSVVTLAPDSYANVRIDGYIGMGRNNDFGDIIGGLILRAKSEKDFYTAYINFSGGSNATFYISESVLGIIGEPFAFLRFQSFDPLHEDYHVIFEATNNYLTAYLSRESLINGTLVETAIGALSAEDDTLTTGRVGLVSFARTNHVFYDDVSVTSVPEPHTTFLLLGSVLFGLYRR